MGTYLPTMLAITHTKSFFVLHKMWVVIIIDYFFESIECFLKGLSIMSPSSLQPHSVLVWPKHCNHKLRRWPWAMSKLLKIVTIHGICIYPVYVSHALYLSGFVTLNKVTYKEAFAFGLNVVVMTFCRTCSGSTGWAHRWILITNQRCAAWAFCSFKVNKCPIPSIKFIIQFISWSFHSIEHIKAPVQIMMVFSMLMRTYVAHSHLASIAILQWLYIWKYLRVMQLTSW